MEEKTKELKNKRMIVILGVVVGIVILVIIGITIYCNNYGDYTDLEPEIISLREEYKEYEGTQLRNIC